jgi:hemoglobin/transferrin/lactoferrin receptor protein
MKYKLLFLILSLCSSALSSAQQHEISVTDKVSGDRLPDVMMNTTSSGASFSDKAGTIRYEPLKFPDTLIFTRLGYRNHVVICVSSDSIPEHILLIPSPLNMQEVIVTASRTSEDAREAPFMIKSIPAMEVRQINPLTSADLLQGTGQVNVQKSQAGGGSPVIRGFEANKVLLVVDGVRLNNAIYRGGHLQNVITIDPFIINKAEVLFGPASVMFGTDALGGVMNFISKEPLMADNDSALATTGDLAVRFASANNASTGHIDFSIAKRKFGSLTSVSYSIIDDLRAGTARPSGHGNWGKRDLVQVVVNGTDTVKKNADPAVQSPSGYKQLDILQKFRWEPDVNTSHTINLQFSRSGDVPRYDRLTDTLDNGSFRFADWYYGPQVRSLAAYSLEKEVVSAFADEFHFTAAYQFIEESRNTRGFGSPDLTGRTEQLNIGSLNMDLQKATGAGEFSYGFEAIFNHVNSSAAATNIYTSEVSEASTRYPAGGSEYYSASVYALNKNRIGSWIFEQGIRFNYTGIRSEFGDTTFYKFPLDDLTRSNLALSGVLGLVYLPGDRSKVYLNASSGYRVPNIDDLSKVFDSTPGNVIIPNSDLKPEYTINLETGFTLNVNDRVRWLATGWYTWYRDAIITVPSTYNGEDSLLYDGVMSAVYKNDNAQRAYIYGFSSTLSADLAEGLLLEASVTKTIGKVETEPSDVPLDHIPPLFGKVSLNYVIKKITVHLYSHFNGEKPADEYGLSGEDNLRYAIPDGSPSWITYNAGFEFRYNKNSSMQVAIENIADTHYRVFSSGISAPGRNLIVTLRTHF